MVPSPLSTLPVSLTPLIGRRIESVQAVSLLCDPSVRLLTLTGPGGVGKSRLAMRVAADASEAFADGVTFVSLAPIFDPGLVPGAIAAAVGITDSGDGSLEEQLTAYLRDRQRLLLLDNVEQVLTSAPFIAALLAACSRIKVMVTSRAPLAIEGEQQFPIPPLDLPESGESQAAIIETSAAVQLFMQRAHAVCPDLILTAANAATIAEICHRMDGLPLAIELAAMRTKILSPAALLARLNHRLELLGGTRRDVPDRHRTMRQAIAWSYDLLTPSEQALFRKLAVFSGCDLETIETICDMGTPDGVSLFDQLQGLIDHSLLRLINGQDGQPRYVMLETLREYGLAQLEDRRELADVRRRHAGWCLTIAERVEAAFYDPAHDTVLDLAERELDNLRTALNWAVAHQEIETGLKLACGLWLFWLQRSHAQEGVYWFERTLDHDIESFSNVRGLRAKAMLGMAGLNTAQSVHAAEEIGKECLSLYQSLNDAIGIARASHMLGAVTLQRGAIDQSISFLEAAVDGYSTSGLENRLWLALSLALLAQAVAVAGDADRAATLLRRAWSVRRELGNTWPEFFPLPGEERANQNEPVSITVSPLEFGITVQRVPLTTREHEVLRLVVDGFSSREIADALFISPRTATTHITHIYDKLGVDNRATAVATALRRHLV